MSYGQIIYNIIIIILYIIWVKIQTTPVCVLYNSYMLDSIPNELPSENIPLIINTLDIATKHLCYLSCFFRVFFAVPQNKLVTLHTHG